MKDPSPRFREEDQRIWAENIWLERALNGEYRFNPMIRPRDKGALCFDEENHDRSWVSGNLLLALSLFYSQGPIYHSL